MTSGFTPIILQVLERAPQWIRQDLGSKEPAIRLRAEETLAAMIASALGDTVNDAGISRKQD
jgi:hypothetical protein